MVYDKVTNLVICVSVAIGPVGPKSNFGRLFIILIENTSAAAEFEYRPFKMPLTPCFTLVTTRGQCSIPRLIINPTRGQYHSNGTTLSSLWWIYMLFVKLPWEVTPTISIFMKAKYLTCKNADCYIWTNVDHRHLTVNTIVQDTGEAPQVIFCLVYIVLVSS